MATEKSAKRASSRVIDLDEARTARQEAQAEPVVLKIGGEDFTLPPEIPFLFAEHSRTGDLKAALEALLGDQADAFFALDPSIDDLNVFSEAIAEVYGIEPEKQQP